MVLVLVREQECGERGEVARRSIDRWVAWRHEIMSLFQGIIPESNRNSVPQRIQVGKTTEPSWHHTGTMEPIKRTSGNGAGEDAVHDHGQNGCKDTSDLKWDNKLRSIDF